MIDIVELIKNDNRTKTNTPKICMIEGPWGIGKTYYVKQNICPKIERDFKNIVTISLFGMKNKEEIKNQIIDEHIMKKSNRIKYISFIILLGMLIYAILYIFNTKSVINFQIPIKLSDDSIFILFAYNHLRKIMSFLFDCFCIFLLFLTMGIYPIRNIILALHNKYLGSGLSLNKVRVNNLFESKNTLFIFDDLERISDTADIREILGFINELRENERFNIIIIANEEELNRIHNIRYQYYKEKMCIDKYNMTYNPDIYEQLTKTDDIELKILYDRLVKSICTISTKNSIPQTNNLRIIILFINIVKKVYNKLKKDNVSIVESNINSILNADKNNKLCTYGVLANLKFYFNQYINHIDDLKENIIKFDENKFSNILEDTIKWSNLSIIDDKYIEENFEKTKLSLILEELSCLDFIIENYEQAIKEIIDCENQINSFADFQTILIFFIQYGKECIETNKYWLSKMFDIWLKEGSSSDLENVYINIAQNARINMIDNELIKFIKSDNILSWFINALNNEHKLNSLTTMFKIILDYNPDVLLKIDFNKYRPFIAYVFNNITKDEVNNIQILKQIKDSLDPNLQKVFNRSILKIFK